MRLGNVRVLSEGNKVRLQAMVRVSDLCWGFKLGYEFLVSNQGYCIKLGFKARVRVSVLDDAFKTVLGSQIRVLRQGCGFKIGLKI